MQLAKNTSVRLTQNFCLDEFTISQEAERHGYRNEPNEKQIENLRLLCVNLLQPLREIIAVPIFINSGFRSFDVNAAAGGKFNSQHLEGKAADFIVPSMNLIDVFNIVLHKLSFDQLIYEFGNQPRLDRRVKAGWIHVSWNGDKNRTDVMISKKVYGKTVYERAQNSECRIMNENTYIWIIGGLLSFGSFAPLRITRLFFCEVFDE